ncbi:uncharacterized protein LOC120251214 [Dioscorea cayenensis subsp. rotundata]|uniref:Uncharacterized protein LOC120251214 n=1 Tax=Dioscorea cayennensis subsp. rotundata TaxID=55577 RepID=A0AB40AKZ8_DIOCR|nr:uncharacterized protein LOC120251214 [Dioscorea cayenensis subsp. rotundata]
MDWAVSHKIWEKWASSTNIASTSASSGSPIVAALLLNHDPTAPSRLLSVIAEQEGTNLKAVELYPFLDFVKRNNPPTEYFFIGENQYLVTSIHEHWFCARCVNTSKPAGEGAIVMQAGAFLLVAMYEGSIGAASQAMVAVDQLAWQLNRRIH